MEPLGMVVAAIGLLGMGAACMSLGVAMPDPSPAARPSPRPVATGPVVAAPSPAAPSPAAPPVLAVNAVHKRYGTFNALSAVSFDGYAGEAIALWGANGAGKTTLLKAILGLIDFDGAIRVHGRDVKRDGKAARRSMGYVPQDVTLYDMSARATLRFFAHLKHAPLARVDELLTGLGLSDHADKPVPALSGGLRQRLALAIALLSDPPVLLLDEPTANLDAQAQHDYLALLSQLCAQQGKTIIFASHRLEEIESLAGRVLVLEHGRLVDVLTPAQLLARLMPSTRLALWVPEGKRELALRHVTDAGLSAHLNGRGTVVVEVTGRDRMKPLRVLSERGVPVLDFELERGQAWS
jgi:ABC-type multidrug transport system ATPase subunit